LKAVKFTKIYALDKLDLAPLTVLQGSDNSPYYKNKIQFPKHQETTTNKSRCLSKHVCMFLAHVGFIIQPKMICEDRNILLFLKL